MNIFGFGSKVHIPDALHLDRHTTAGATQRKTVMSTIMRRVSSHWTDAEAQKQVLTQKGKILNAIHQLQDELKGSKNLDPQKTAKIDKQILTLAKRVNEVRYWEADYVIPSLHGQQPEKLETLAKSLEKTAIESVTYKAGENLKAVLKGVNDKLTPKEQKQVAAILKTNFFNIEDLETAFATAKSILANNPNLRPVHLKTPLSSPNINVTQRGTPVVTPPGAKQTMEVMNAADQIAYIRAAFEESLPPNLANYLAEATQAKEAGRPLSPEQKELLPLAYKILNRHDLNAEEKKALFKCAQEIYRFKHTEGKDAKGYKTTLYRALTPENKAVVDRFMEKLNRGDMYQGAVRAHPGHPTTNVHTLLLEDMKKATSAMGPVYALDLVGKDLKAAIVVLAGNDTSIKNNPKLNSEQKKQLLEIKETHFTDVKQLEKAIKFVRDLVPVLDPRKVGTGGSVLAAVEQQFKDNCIPQSLQSLVLNPPTKPTAEEKELLGLADKIADRQDLLIDQKNQLFLAVKEAVHLKHEKAIGLYGQVTTAHQNLSPARRKEIDQFLERVKESHRYADAKALNADLQKVDAARKELKIPKAIQAYMDLCVKMAGKSKTGKIESPVADILKMASKIAKRDDLDDAEKELLFKRARALHEMKQIKASDADGSSTTLYELLAPEKMKQATDLLQKIEKEIKFSRTATRDEFSLLSTTVSTGITDALKTYANNHVKHQKGPIPTVEIEGVRELNVTSVRRR